jgi:hypothetical protein
MYIVNLIVTLFNDAAVEEKNILVETRFIVIADIKISNVQIGSKVAKLEDIHTEESMSLVYYSENNDLHLFFSIIMANSDENNYLIVNKNQYNPPHQVMVKFIHQHTNNTVLINVPLSADGVDLVNNTLKYHLTLSLINESIVFLYRNGLYNVSILVADYYYSSVKWKLGVLELDLPKKPAIQLPLYTNSLLHVCYLFY